ncbi:MAG TPA: DUF2158 domain-containing protein [Allosphingosinicella sp.]|nr:DUF2158 domain-containing protein [Allosphingosinicella sp.]
MTLKSGDVVQLKSGGPLMVVESIDDYGGTTKALCSWFDKANHKNGLFPLPALELYEEE